MGMAHLDNGEVYTMADLRSVMLQHLREDEEAIAEYQPAEREAAVDALLDCIDFEPCEPYRVKVFFPVIHYQNTVGA